MPNFDISVKEELLQKFDRLLLKIIATWSSNTVIYYGRLQRRLKGAFSGLRQFLSTESLLKIMKKFFLFHLKVRLSPSKKVFYYLLQRKPFKNDEKCFLFHLKSSFHSQDILIFLLTFFSCRKNDLMRKIRLISKFLTSQPG